MCPERVGAFDGDQPFEPVEASAEHPPLPVVQARTLPRASRHSPRNFLERHEQRKLFWVVMPPAIMLVLVAVWLEHTFFGFPTATPSQQVDTRLVGGPRGLAGDATDDAIVIEPAPEPLAADSGHRGASAEALSKVRDDTVFRESDKEAWFAIWSTLRESDPGELRRLAGPAKGFTELFAQPRSFRGKPVRIRGTLRRLQRVEAGSNTLDIDAYWQGWLDPEGGPPSPIVVYFLSVPVSIHPGQRLVEPVEVVGYFFKRWAYQATDTIRTAPLVMALEPTPLTPSRPREPTNFLAVVLWTGGILAVIAFFLAARKHLHTRALLAVLLLSVACPTRALAEDKPAGASTGPAPLTAGDYLSRFQLAAADRAAEGSVTEWSETRLDIGLRMLARLAAAPQSLKNNWARDAISPPPAATVPPSESDAPVRVVGRAVRVRELSLPPDLRVRHARATIPVVSIRDTDGLTVDVLTLNVPQAWPRDTELNEPADTVGIMLARQAGPLPSIAPTSPQASTTSPPEVTIVADRVAWRPGTPLGALGMDYGLFDAVRDGRKLTSEDADAFYGMLAAAGRANPTGLHAATDNTPDILQLIDPQVRWIESHRGDPVRIRGTARRALRVAVDDPIRQAQLGTDHYWELYVFVPTPTAVQIGDRVQDSYPVVCCVQELPPSMPHGERIAEDVDVAGFAFKRYRYPLALSTEAGSSQESPLILGRRVRWIPSSEPKSTQPFEVVFGGLLVLAISLIVAAGWLTSGGRRRRRKTPS